MLMLFRSMPQCSSTEHGLPHRYQEQWNLSALSATPLSGAIESVCHTVIRSNGIYLPCLPHRYQEQWNLSATPLSGAMESATPLSGAMESICPVCHTVIRSNGICLPHRYQEQWNLSTLSATLLSGAMESSCPDY